MSLLLPGYRWQFLVNPNYSWIQSFSDQLISTDVAIIEDVEDDKPSVYLWSSRHLTELDDVKGVAARALGLKVIFDGALYLQRKEEFCTFPLGELYDATENRRVRYIEDTTPELYPYSHNSNRWIYPRDDLHSPFRSFAGMMQQLAKYDGLSRGMLQFLGTNGPTWIALYALLDFLKHADITSEKIAALAKKPESELKRFTQTANNYAAIGPFSRHGDKGWKPPELTMTLPEARILVLTAVSNYLISRCKELDLANKWMKGAV